MFPRAIDRDHGNRIPPASVLRGLSRHTLSIPAQRTHGFDVPAKTTHAIDLMAKPFSDASDCWMHPTDYKPCQQLEEQAHADDIQLIRYASVRDPEHKPNAADSEL